MTGLLLIRGLGHSGSTILDLAIGAHPSMLGLGEAVRILKRPKPGEEQRGPAQLRADLKHQRLCTCGRVAAHCPVWSGVLEWLPHHDHLPLAEKLPELLAAVERTASGQGLALDWIVESYQDDLETPELELADREIRILYLVRDVRSWVHSRSRAARKKGEPLPGLRSLGRWWKANRRFQRFFRACDKPVFVLGYEELALAPEPTLTRLCGWLGLDFSPAMLHPGLQSKSHILAGNRMRFDAEKSAQISYDSDWLGGHSWPASVALLWPEVAHMNRRLVYGNNLLTRPS
ncbi:MAG: sulfotransferase [Cyanobium sp.]